jgi:hypothetical protein
MTTSTEHPLIIEKEKIHEMHFAGEEVLASPEERKTRLRNLERALALGNLEKAKVKIVFEDTEGIKQVETTVWGVTDKRVILKGGIHIPIHRVHEVKI